MAWITPTAETVKRRLSGPEFTSLQNAARSSGQDGATLTTETITRVVNMIRGYVGAAKNPPNILGIPGTIPDELESALGSLWLWEFITRLPGQEKLLDDRRKTLYDNAIAQLKDVSAGRFAIVPPETPGEETEQPSGPASQLISSRDNLGTRAQTAGLL
ncbi:hypothetical protein GCM10023213_14060 [Prosthecobacter algae]|uniref:Phage gp36-like protein n=1 Tax=Prosthecobacter algae TaxID=1144682 RepID=A0ABP9P041_9BACT